MKFILSSTLLFIASFAFAQSFEGTLTYAVDFELSQNLMQKGVAKQTMLKNMRTDGTWADTVRISYKKGDYYVHKNTTPKSWSIYKSKDNKIFGLKDGPDADICTVLDASVDLEKYTSGKKPTVEKLDTIIKIDGLKCNIVRVTWNSGTSDYYYQSTMLSIDPLLFANHVYDAWAEYLKISKALPLRIVKSTKGEMTVTMKLVGVKEQSVQDQLFAIPTLVPDKKLNNAKTDNPIRMRIKKG
jgi:hypothetical protein